MSAGVSRLLPLTFTGRRDILLLSRHEESEEMTSVCIEDFCGRCSGLPTSYWADWDGTAVGFGGEWQDIPDMPTDIEPTPNEVNQWAKDHGADIYTINQDGGDNRG